MLQSTTALVYWTLELSPAYKINLNLDECCKGIAAAAAAASGNCINPYVHTHTNTHIYIYIYVQLAFSHTIYTIYLP